MRPHNTLSIFQPRSLFFVILPIVLSCITHLWNPVGFPDLFYDEGVYMRRAMHVLEGLGPQESNSYYDHPFFGQIFLASIFKIIDYPHFIIGENPSFPDRNTINMLYLVPRLIMGMLAVLDTFLIFKISDKMYGRNVGILSSALFAVMPMTWILRRILLDSIVLPFLLLSILFAVYSADSKTRNGKIMLFALSGILMGISIFTKVPVFAMMPFILYLILRKDNTRDQNQPKYHTRLKLLVFWLIPVLLIPSLWPLQSIISGHFDSWLNTAIWQAQRGERMIGLPWIIGAFALFDPILLVLGLLGGILAVLKRSVFIILWASPYLIFLAFIGQTNYFNWSILLPVICIASAVMLLESAQRVASYAKCIRIPVNPIFILSILITGLISTSMIISLDMSGSQIESAMYVMSYLQNYHEVDKQITIISSPVYSWIFKYAFHSGNALDDYRDILFFPIKTSEWILVADLHYRTEMSDEPVLQKFYNESETIAEYDSFPPSDALPAYPETNLTFTKEGDDVEIRIS